MTRQLLAPLLLSAALALAACDGGGDSPSAVPHSTNPTGIAREGDEQVRVVARYDAETALRKVADQTAGIVGLPLSRWVAGAAPCENAAGDPATDGRWFLSGAGQVGEVAPDKQVAMLHRLRDTWTGLGYEITEFRLLPAGDTGGAVSVRVPDSGVRITVQSTVKRTGLAVVVDSPCYRPVSGEDPANQG